MRSAGRSSSDHDLHAVAAAVLVGMADEFNIARRDRDHAAAPLPSAKLNDRQQEVVVGLQMQRARIRRRRDEIYRARPARVADIGDREAIAEHVADKGMPLMAGPLKRLSLAEPQSSPVPDWSIRELFLHIRPDLPDAVDNRVRESVGADVIDKISTGQLTVWGRRIEDSKRLPLAKIRPENWQRAKFTY